MGEDVLAVFIPIIAIFMSLLIPIVYAITDYRRRRDIVEAHHKERLAAIERGMEIPPLPEAFFKPLEKNEPAAPPADRHDLVVRGHRSALFLGAVAGPTWRSSA